jgi:hypothetical protein
MLRADDWSGSPARRRPGGAIADEVFSGYASSRQMR